MSGPLVTNATAISIGRDRKRPAPDPPPSSVPVSTSQSSRIAQVYLETAMDSGEFELAAENVRWASMHRGIDGENHSAVIVATLDAEKLTVGGAIGDEHFAQLLSRIHPDLRVRIAIPAGFNGPFVLFQGYPQTQKPSWSPNHQTIAFDCLSEGQDRLRFVRDAHVLGRLMRRSPGVDPATLDTPDVVTVTALPAVFNPDGKPNCLNQPIAMPFADQPDVVLFAFSDDDFIDAIHWSYLNALRYVAYYYAREAGVDVSDLFVDTDALINLPVNAGAQSGDPWLTKMLANVDGVSIQSMNAEEALVALISAAGLHMEIMTRNRDGLVNYALRIYASISDGLQEDASRARMMITPAVRDIRRDAPFTDYAGLTDSDIARRNEAQKADLVIDSRVRTATRVLAGPHDIEVTLLLRPGWLPHGQLDNLVTQQDRTDAIDFWEDQFGVFVENVDPDTGQPISLFHRRHPDHHTVADVARLWIFPDTAAYVTLAADSTVTSAYARDSGTFGDAKLYSPINDAGQLIYVDSMLGGGLAPLIVKDWVQRPRPFGDTIGRASMATTQRTPIVRFNFNATDAHTALLDPNWVVYKGNAVFDRKRAAMLITDDNLIMSALLRADADDVSSSMLHQYINGHFMVSITCTVRSDLRLDDLEVGSAALLRSRVGLVDLGLNQFAFRDRQAGNSHLAFNVNTEDDPSFAHRNDESLLRAFTQRLADGSGQQATAGSFSIAWLATRIRLGDAFSGVSGLGIRLKTFPDVVSITHVNTPTGGVRTIYQLTDLRDRPEVGAE